MCSLRLRMVSQQNAVTLAMSTGTKTTVQSRRITQATGHNAMSSASRTQRMARSHLTMGRPADSQRTFLLCCVMREG